MNSAVLTKVYFTVFQDGNDYDDTTAIQAQVLTKWFEC